MKMFIATLLLAVRLTTPYIEHTPEDVQLLAEVAYLENGSTGDNEDENIQALIATMAVVCNRMKGEGWGGPTMKGVIYMRGQYASDTKNRIGKAKVPQYVIDLAEEVLTYGTNVPDYVVYQSMQKNLGTRWKVIDGEYFATNGGHKDEGEKLVITTNKKAYQQQLMKDTMKKLCRAFKDLRRELKRKFK